jgi:hypothetical protein
MSSGNRLLGNDIEGVNGGGQERYRFQFVPNGTSSPAVYTSYTPTSSGPTYQTPSKGTGISSITRLGVGLIGVQLADTSPGVLLGFWACAVTGSALTGTPPNQTITPGNLAGYEFAIVSNVAGLVVIGMYAAGGTTLTDPANDGSAVTCEMVFSKDPTNAY